VTIYVVRNDAQVRRLKADGKENVYACYYYSPRAGASFAIMPKVKTSTSEQDMPVIARSAPAERCCRLGARTDDRPTDKGVRILLVLQRIKDKRYEDAASALIPIAFNPHGRYEREATQASLDQ
jgi:thioredoxin-like negative regulator of GroEL